MKILHFPLLMLVLASILFLDGCADQANQDSNRQTNAAIAPTPPPPNFRNIQPIQPIQPMQPMGRY